MIRQTDSGAVVPTVHLNGTNQNDLREQWYNSYRAVSDAITMLTENGPNARDYYVQDEATAQGTSYRLAREQHVSRLKKLQEVQAELLSIFEAIDDQPGRKATL